MPEGVRTGEDGPAGPLSDADHDVAPLRLRQSFANAQVVLGSWGPVANASQPALNRCPVADGPSGARTSSKRLRAQYTETLMRAVIQRVSSAKVTVGDECCGTIARGLLVLLGVGRGDTSKDIAYLVAKTAGLRVFAGPDRRMMRSAKDVGAAILAVPQFTLFGDVRRGLRPSFDSAAQPAEGAVLFREYVRRLRQEGLTVETGRFGAHMRLELANDGPVTILIDSTKLL